MVIWGHEGFRGSQEGSLTDLRLDNIHYQGHCYDDDHNHEDDRAAHSVLAPVYRYGVIVFLGPKNM